MEIYEICKNNREQLGLTILEFCKSINIDVEVYKKFEKGEYIFSKDIMKIILSILYVDYSEFKNEDIYDEIDDEEIRDITKISLKVIEECEKGE